MTPRILIPIAAIVLLAGCNDKTAETPPATGALNAEGDVQQGSISDEMLPLDQLKSQSPPAKIEKSADGPEPSSNAADRPGESPAAAASPASDASPVSQEGDEAQ